MPVSVSFRDPDGSVLCSDRRIFRKVAADRVADFTEFVNSRTAEILTSNDRLVGTRELAGDIDAELDERGRAIFQSLASAGHMFEHDRIWFPSYPYEWAPDMLFQAGRLTLDIAEAALDEGYGLKDATPFNVLFNGPDPIFVDVLSFERRAPG